jgi:RNA polymerase sigma factor
VDLTKKIFLTPTKKFLCSGITILGVNFLIAFMINLTKHPIYSVSESLAKIKGGDPELKNQFITQYKPFIQKTVSEFLGRKYREVEDSEEFSIGLIAFDEAIHSYNESKNRNFFDFARQVIKRRIINYWVSNQKQGSTEYPFTYFQREDNPEFLETIPDQTVSFTQTYETKEEIELLKSRLMEFGITINDLVLCAPKHRDSKLLAIGIAKIISGNEDLFKQMMTRKFLPMLELLKVANVNKRTLERNRKFIIAICLILRSDLEILKDYINQTIQSSEIR